MVRMRYVLMLQAKPPAPFAAFPAYIISLHRPLFVLLYTKCCTGALRLTVRVRCCRDLFKPGVQIKDNKMLSTIFFAAVFLVTAEAVKPPTEKCNSVTSNTCFQQCNSTSCNCAPSVEGYVYNECSQACGSTQCKEITCSSGTCYQKCHDCRMECTSDVDYCSQQCLSGACSFKCSAKRCVQECGGKECKDLPSGHDEPFIPRLYLVILAGLFAATTILTCLALVLSCSQMGCRRRRPVRLVTRDLGSSVRSLPTKSTLIV